MTSSIIEWSQQIRWGPLFFIESECVSIGGQQRRPVSDLFLPCGQWTLKCRQACSSADCYLDLLLILYWSKSTKISTNTETAMLSIAMNRPHHPPLQHSHLPTPLSPLRLFYLFLLLLLLSPCPGSCLLYPRDSPSRQSKSLDGVCTFTVNAYCIPQHVVAATRHVEYLPHEMSQQPKLLFKMNNRTYNVDTKSLKKCLLTNLKVLRQ